MNFWEELRVAYYDMVELKVSLGYNEGTYRTSHILPFVEYCCKYFPVPGRLRRKCWIVG